METINISKELNKLSYENNKFIILGSKNIENPEFVNEFMLPKINDKKSKLRSNGFWGTLGFSNDEAINWSGSIDFSGNGNTKDFEDLVKTEINKVIDGIPDLKENPDSIVERFISFENLDFQFKELFTLDEIPELRLDVMLEPDEGALVFYQGYSDKDVQEELVYIQPKPTDNNNNTNERDRLTYIFDVLPKGHLEKDKLLPDYYKINSKKRKTPFVIKILTFKRTYSNLAENKEINSKTIIKQAEVEINKAIQGIRGSGLPKDHRVLIFNKKKNDFDEAKPEEIKSEAKTLFLMHGTFSNTEGSFGDLYGEKGEVLMQLMNNDNTLFYSQIISFDHPTIFDGAEENINKLYECFTALKVQPFKEDVDFIGTSQGGLLVQYLANANQNKMNVGKVALVASANGVGYLSGVKYVPKLLSIIGNVMKSSGNLLGAIVASLAQHSAEFVLEQPGLKLMTPGSDELKYIIRNTPFTDNTSYYPIVSDYDRKIFNKRRPLCRFFLRLIGGAADAFAKPFLGQYNDLVVGTREQFIVPQKYSIIPKHTPDKYREYTHTAMHGTSFKHKDILKELNGFLTNPDFATTIKSLEPSKFDAHCHIFGRDIITSRILFLLMDDIVKFRKNKSDDLKLPAIKENNKKKNKEGGSVIINIVKYFILNKDSFDVLDDLSEEYNNLDSGVYRYIPLMFDLEMTFRSKYNDNDIEKNLEGRKKDFSTSISEFKEDLDDLINKVENHGELVFSGNKLDNLSSIKYLKIIKKIIDVEKIINPQLNRDVVSGFQRQLDELTDLKERYGDNIFPFLAVDPRRKGIAKLIKENVGRDKTFRGVKLYAPNGYSPTDPKLFDDASKFIDGKCLYSYCIENEIPIMIHCSNAGFSTFVAELEVCGDVIQNDKIITYKTPTMIYFKKNVPAFKFLDGVKERATALNHPRLWKIVLEKHTHLKICFGHFGGASQNWRNLIAELLEIYPNTYTDLSCMVKKDRLKTIKNNYFNQNSIIKDRIMYGSDFYLNMLGNIKFKNYYKHFSDIFSKAELRKMSIDIPQKFLR